MNALRLTLGPVFFHWPAERLADFYRRIADEAPVDRVHVGEVVCGKRMPFSDPAWPDIIERLERGGKEVVISTLASPTNIRERRSVSELCADGRLVEVNGYGALPARGAQPFVTGPLLNVYNEVSAQWLIDRGARTICPPVEIPAASVGRMAKGCSGADFEIFAFGRLPLALSGRCYHARLHGLHKDSCQFKCELDPDGLAVDTLDDQAFLAINGVQTLSNQVHAFCPTPTSLRELAIARLRLSPHGVDMVAVARTYRALLDGTLEPSEVQAELAARDLPGAIVDGYAHGVAGWKSPASASVH